MKNKVKKKETLKNSIISIRFDEKSKKMIEKRAKKLNMSISDYIRECCLAGMNTESDMQRISMMTVIGQEICNYIEKNYNGDDFLEEKVNKIWFSLL